MLIIAQRFEGMVGLQGTQIGIRLIEGCSTLNQSPQEGFNQTKTLVKDRRNHWKTIKLRIA